MKKKLLSSAVIASLLASTTPSVTIKKPVTSSKNSLAQRSSLLLSSPATDRNALANLINVGMEQVQKLIQSSPKKQELEDIYRQLSVLKQDVTQTLSVLLQQEQQVRQSYIMKVKNLLKRVRQYRQHVRNKQTLKEVSGIIILLSYLLFWSQLDESRQDATLRRKRVIRLYQQMDRVRQSELSQQIKLLQMIRNTPKEFLCPLTGNLKMIPVHIGKEKETYDAVSLIEWVKTHLPHYQQKHVSRFISSFVIDHELQDRIYEYLLTRHNLRKRVLPDYMEVARYYPGTGSQQYMQALERFNRNKQKI